jgi:hypothetical protein
MIAYKDPENSQCYLERMKGSESGLRHKLRRIQSPEMRDEPRTMYVPENILSKYEVSMRRMQFQWRGRGIYISTSKRVIFRS